MRGLSYGDLTRDINRIDYLIGNDFGGYGRCVEFRKASRDSTLWLAEWCFSATACEDKPSLRCPRCCVPGCTGFTLSPDAVSPDQTESTFR